jgi:hypothetical protein
MNAIMMMKYEEGKERWGWSGNVSTATPSNHEGDGKLPRGEKKRKTKRTNSPAVDGERERASRGRGAATTIHTHAKHPE